MDGIVTELTVFNGKKTYINIIYFSQKSISDTFSMKSIEVFFPAKTLPVYISKNVIIDLHVYTLQLLSLLGC